MARVTVAEVLEIIDSDITSAQVLAFITAANIIVTNGPATSTSPALGSDELKEIERWLAAHLVCMRDPRELRHKTGDAEAWFFPVSATTAWGKGLALTPYGQQALMLDRSGKLETYGQKKGSYRAVPREDSSSYTDGLTKA